MIYGLLRAFFILDFVLYHLFVMLMFDLHYALKEKMFCDFFGITIKTDPDN